MMAESVDPVLPVFDVALGAFPVHDRLPSLSVRLACSRILTPECLQRQITEPLPFIPDADIHLVIGIGALDHDSNLRGPALRTDVAAMNFFAGKDYVKINGIDTIISPTSDIPVTLQ